ncbi:hypothetical protein HDE_10522 [Halotydeus destructor]|nr:hypothetical protein HDE_10522 [Halotydeus destructor]
MTEETKMTVLKDELLVGHLTTKRFDKSEVSELNRSSVELLRTFAATERNVGCTGAFVSSAYELKQKVLEFEACQPKMAVVTQNVTDTSSTYSSNSILVQQCGGKCSNPNHSCMPPEDSEMKIVEYPVTF